MTGRADEAKGTVSFSVDAPADRLIAFYREKGAAAGLVVVAEANMGPARMLSMEREGTSDAAMQVTVPPPEQGTRTQAMIVYSVEGG